MLLCRSCGVCYKLVGTPTRGCLTHLTVDSFGHRPHIGKPHNQRVKCWLIMQFGKPLFLFWSYLFHYVTIHLTTHLNSVSRLRMPGDVPLLPQYVFMAWCLIKHWIRFTVWHLVKHRHLMHGTIPPLSQYVFMAWHFVKPTYTFICTFDSALNYDLILVILQGFARLYFKNQADCHINVFFTVILFILLLVTKLSQ
jgi:hypothetical protein